VSAVPAGHPFIHRPPAVQAWRVNRH
jgi:hypothetical protein